jgi:hypothetical protein
MTTRNLIIVSFIGIFASSCASSSSRKQTKKYCGHEMNFSEINEISSWTSHNPNVYNAKNGTEIYSEINDSIRHNIPDSITFELFLTKLTDNEVVIDSYVPNDKKLIEEIACILMNTKFSKIVPDKRKIRFYSYTNPDGSGDSQFEMAIKN